MPKLRIHHRWPLTLALALIGCPAQDTSPNDFQFIGKTIGSLSGLEVCSENVQITGINVPVQVTPGTDAKFRLNNAPSSNAAGTTLVNGAQLAACTNAPTSPGSKTVGLTVGNLTREFTVTVNAPAATASFSPDQFITPSDSDAGVSVSSNELTVGGLASGVGVPASVQNGELFINGSKAILNQTVKSGDKVQVRLTSSATPGASVKATLDVGGVKRDFQVKTKDGASQPPSFSPDQFSNAVDADTSTLVSSNKLTISGLAAGATLPVSVNAGELYVNDLKAGVGQTVKNGDTVQIRLTSSATAGATLSATLTVGVAPNVVQRGFSVKTKTTASGGPQTPGSTENYAPSTTIPGTGLEVVDASPTCAADGSVNCLGDPTQQPGAITSVAFNVPKTGKVAKVALKLLVQHGHRSDLIIRLAHAGTTVAIYDLTGLRASGGLPSNDGNGNDTGLSLVFDDVAKLPGSANASTIEVRCGPYDSKAITDPTYNKYAGNCWDNFIENTTDNPSLTNPPAGFGRFDRATASQPLAAFNDLELGGDWTLSVQDVAPGNTGRVLPIDQTKPYKRPGNKAYIKLAQLLITAK